MAIFSNDLTPEEINSGFSIDEPDNDSFALGAFNNKYPNEISDYNTDSFINSINEKSAVEINNSQTENIIDLENSNITEVNIENNNDNDLNTNNNSDAQASKVDDINSFEDILDMPNSNNDILDSANDISIDNIEETEVLNVENENPDEKIDLDDDFINMLKNDLEKNKTDKEESISQNEENIDEVLKVEKVEVNFPADSNAQELSADLISETITTSNKISNEQENEESEPTLATDEQTTNEEQANNEVENIDEVAEVAYKQTQKNENENTQQQQKENISTNNKKRFTLIAMIVVLVAILFIGGIIGYLWLDNKHNIPNIPNIKTTKKTDTTQTSKDTIEEIVDVDVDVIADTIAIDTNKIAEDTTFIDTAKPIEKLDIKPEINQVPKKTIVQQKTEQKPLPTKQQTPNTINAIYTIQIYSSPNRDAAQKRLEVLATQGLEGTITEQQIKGNTWYRVRFGRYHSYDLAIEAANRYGYIDAWIEKIK